MGRGEGPPRVFPFPSSPARFPGTRLQPPHLRTTQRDEVSSEEKVLFPKPRVQRSCELFPALSISQLVGHIINYYELWIICLIIFLPFPTEQKPAL